MQWMGLNEIREKYLAFFEGKDHIRLPSAPLVPQDDASLLLINSGMAPLKKYFLGLDTPPGPRATSCQKCIRTPDIDRVGKTSRHGTFFEMLGNFSFGDYFKEDATKWAWEFITEVMQIPLDRLWVSIYQDDEEAFEIWTKNRGVPADRIVRLGKEDNFWEIGSGPCGPCSEIYFDRGEQYACDNPNCAVGCDCDRYVEFWNLVFTQYNSDGEGTYTPLEKPNIDTGMGLERLACIMQGVDNLFEVDTMQNIMGHVAKTAGVSYKADPRSDVSLRVVTDHVRSTVFMIGDGVIPSNEGRGYVLRRLLRRAARHGRLLGIREPFLYEICETVIFENKDAYPELTENAAYIKKVIRNEEDRFAKTVEQGLNMLNELIEHISTHKTGGIRTIAGEAVFRLYDTFGFPFDLTREIAEDKGIQVDEEGFLRHMAAQRERARSAREARGGVGWEEDLLSDQEFHDEFVGYHELMATTRVLHIVRDNELVEEVREGEQAVIFLRSTPFYAESGGQVGDTGIINVGKSMFRVNDCKKSPTGHYMHIGEVVSGFVCIGDTATVKVDQKRRQAIMRNHTAAHLLQEALRKILGSHVHQAGSMVDSQVCRFDFTHFSALTPEQLEQVEQRVNNMILSAIPVQVSEMGMEEARAQGALALFSDKYTSVVRVCNIGGKSIELCGGTHVENTAQLGLFKIITETSVAAGVRRIEAVTGLGVLDLIEEKERILQESCAALKINSPTELVSKATAVNAQVRELQKELEQMGQKLASMQMSAAAEEMKQVGAVRTMTAVLPDATVDALKSTADDLKSRYDDVVGVLVSLGSEKNTLLAFAGKKAVNAGVHAGKLVKEVAALAGGSGGGRPDNAMGGAPDADKIPQALEAVCSLVEQQQAKGTS